MPTANQDFGQFGEKIAERYLKKKGYQILAHHYTTRWGEIDFIACDQKELVFIEVKSRRTPSYGLPEEAVTPNKLNHLIKAIYDYLSNHDLSETDCRIDVISVFFNSFNKAPLIKHFKNISF